MSSFKLEFKTDGAAFDGDDKFYEIDLILRTVAELLSKIREDCTIKVYDSNGNHVGAASFTE